jgi:membrane fusion protein (multidrug efflux system)
MSALPAGWMLLPQRGAVESYPASMHRLTESSLREICIPERWSGTHPAGLETLPIVQIVDTGHLRLVVPVPQAYVAEMQTGQQAVFSVPAYPGQTFHAPITRISHDVDPNTRTMPVKLDVQSKDGRLSPGSFSTVQWTVHRAAPTMLVPVSAVTNDQQRTFVERVLNGKAEWVDVVTGLSVNGNIEVFGDLKPADEVIRNATDAIRAGQQVKTSSSHS